MSKHLFADLAGNLSWSKWEECEKDEAEYIKRTGQEYEPSGASEVRALYTAPQPSEQVEAWLRALKCAEERLSQIDCATINQTRTTPQELLDYCKDIASAGLIELYAARRAALTSSKPDAPQPSEPEQEPVAWRETVKKLRDTARSFAKNDPADDCPAESYIEWQAADLIERIYTHPAPQPSGPVKVKPLDWSGVWLHYAETAIGLYQIEDQGENWTEDRFWLDYSGDRIGKFPSLEAAKAAAQADYERRILSTLTYPVTGEAVALTALERIAAVKEVRRGGGVYDYAPALSAGDMWRIAREALSALKASSGAGP